MFCAHDIAKQYNGKVKGNGDAQALRIAPITDADEHCISVVADKKFYALLPTTRAAIVVCPLDDTLPASPATIVMVQNPMRVFADILGTWQSHHHTQQTGIDPRAVIHAQAVRGNNVSIGAFTIIEEGVVLGDNTVVMSHCFIGKNSHIGTNCLVYSNVVIREEIVIGNNVIIHAGAVIGADGFGFVLDKGAHYKIPQIGTVMIGDDVEIGANTTIDRSTVGATKVGKGTKIDNLVQIAHNVEIGEHCIICAQAGIAGSTIIGNYVTLAGQAGITGHITIGDGAIVAAQAGVTKNIPAKEIVSGYPATPHKEAIILHAHTKKLPGLFTKVRELERRIFRDEKTTNDKA